MTFDDFEKSGLDNFKAPANKDPFYTQAVMMAEVMKRTLKQKADIDLSDRPEIELVPIVNFMKRMRVWGLDKFKDKIQNRCYQS